MYQYVMYLIAMIILLILSVLSVKLTLKEQYSIQNLYLILYMIIFCGSQLYILTVILTLFIIIFSKVLLKKKYENLPIAFYLSISNLIIIVISNILMNYML